MPPTSHQKHPNSRLATLWLSCFVFTASAAPLPAVDVEKPGYYPAFSADDKVYQLLNGYFSVSVERDTSKPGNPITRISLFQPSFMRPDEKQQEKEHRMPLSEALSKALPHLSELKHLHSFHSNQTPLADEDLIHFQNHPSLKLLSIRSGITMDGLRLLKGLSLENLDLPQELKNDEGFSIMVRNLSAPASLNINRWDITDESLALIADFDSLTGLTLSAAPKLTDASLAHLAKLEKLETLNFANLGIDGSGFEHLSGLGNLKKLIINCKDVGDDNLQHLKGLSALREIQIYNESITDEGLAFLSGMPELEALALSGAKIRGSGLRHLNGAKLKSASLRCANLTDEAALHLAKCKNLEKIKVTGKISADGFAALIPLNLKEFEANTFGLKDPLALKNFILADRNDTKFTFRNVPLDDDGMSAFKEVASVTFFASLNTKITDEGLKQLGTREEMTGLDLTGCKITDAGIDTIIEHFPNVGELVLRNTQVSNASLEKLLKMKKMGRLFIRGSKITPDAAKAFAAKHGSCRILN